MQHTTTPLLNLNVILQNAHDLNSLDFVSSNNGENKISSSKESFVSMTSNTKKDVSLKPTTRPPSTIDQEGILSRLLQDHLIILPPRTHKKCYEKTSFCAYHRVHGHSTNECNALSHKIQHFHEFGMLPYVWAPTSSNFYSFSL